MEEDGQETREEGESEDDDGKDDIIEKKFCPGHQEREIAKIVPPPEGQWKSGNDRRRKEGCHLGTTA
jgi:hypothetical protein